MRAVIQRVTEARVSAGGQIAGQIGPGLVILICAMRGDSTSQADRLAARIAKLRIFRDDQDKMNLSVTDTGGSCLVISQFTLAADLKGNRPGFSSAAPPDEGRRLYEHFTGQLRRRGLPVETGIFGADMDVTLVNQGPVTIWMDSDTL